MKRSNTLASSWTHKTTSDRVLMLLNCGEMTLGQICRFVPRDVAAPAIAQLLKEERIREVRRMPRTYLIID